VFETKQLADHIYELSTDAGGYPVKVIASVGDDGVLLVDTGEKEKIDDLKAAVLAFGKGVPRIIISTHAHVEHIGGNATFGGDAVIIGHENLRKRLRTGLYLFDEFPEEALPDICLTDSLSLYFNGEQIKVHAFPGAHDDSDLIIWFTTSKVVCVAGLCNGRHFPSVDKVGGDVLEYPETVQRVIDLLPEDVTIVPGHGEDGTIEDYRAFHAMLVATTDLVRKGIEAGKDRDTLIKEDVLHDWKAWEASYVSADQWIEYLAEGITGVDRKPMVFEPIYYAIRDLGAPAAVLYYHDLKKNKADEYAFDENDLVYIGYKLFKNDRVEESIPFLEASLKESPKGTYAYLCHDYLGRWHTTQGDTARAIRAYERSLKLNPENTHAADMLKELKKK
jgi:glyoxylase-like metal-dependent hydrolase (beta-lactamase superfamily II)